MADFRKWILVLAAVALFAGLASAQSNNIQLTCTATVAVPPQLRSEGFTEEVGDILIACTGGNILPATTQGTQVPTANVTVYMNGQVTSRLLGTAGVSGASEAVLLVDDPNTAANNPSPSYGNTLPFIPCGGAWSGQTSTQAFPLVGAGTNGCNQFIGNGTGGTPASGSQFTAGASGVNFGVPTSGTFVVSSTTTYTPTAAGANVFQGVVSGASVTFFGVPINAPATAGQVRTFRITNLRVNANGITGGGTIPANAVAAVAISGATSLPVNNSTLTVGYIGASLNPTLANAYSTSTSSYASNTSLLQCNGYSGPTAFATLSYRELEGNAFRPRGTTGQSIPAVIYASESFLTVSNNPPSIAGAVNNPFTQTSAATGATVSAGYADFGTRFKAVFNNIPSGVSLFVSVNNLAAAKTPLVQPVPSNSSFASLIVSETSPDSGPTNSPPNNGNLPLITQTGTSTASIGSSPSSAVGYAPLTIINGSATAVWEVVNSLPNTNENFDFEAMMSYTASPSTGSPPAPSAMTVNMSYAPIPTQGAFTASSGGVASASLPIPRFADSSSVKTALSIQICQTALLYPYVTNIAGFDTGLSVANTSTDPFGTSPQAGYCSIYWYGTTTPSVNPGYVGANGYQTTIPSASGGIASGTIQAWGTSVVAPNFNGYVIALCNFQYAHGFAFVSDLGARQLAMGYLANVINGSTTGTGGASGRGPIAIESQGN